MSSLKYIHIPDFELKLGTTQNIKLSYQVFGQPLNEAPVVLVNHALTGNSNVTGEDGWWNSLIGDSKCIDTRKYSIIAFNVPGNGYGSSESDLISNYYDFSAKHIAQIFALGLDQLGVENLFAIIGGSVGGGVAWELAVLKPDLTEYLIPIACDWKSTDWIIANCFIQDNILKNSNFPLEDARIHAMTLYRTPESLTHKFQRTKKGGAEFNVESWLGYHGRTLNDRFQLSAYKLMNQILKSIDITKDIGDFESAVKTIGAHIHIVTINSDLLFKPEENWDTFVDLKLFKENVTISEIKSIHGHDAFLIEYEQLNTILRPIFDVPRQENKEEILTKELITKV